MQRLRLKFLPCIKSSKTVYSPSVHAGEISIQLLYRNSLDIHSKHMASHLRDKVNEFLS